MMFPVLSMMKYAFPALFFALVLRPALSAPREPGLTLDLSIKNEMVHAMQQALSWIVDRQDKSGAWCGKEGKPDGDRTALVLFTLRSLRQPETEEACARAERWLAGQSSLPNATLEGCAWRLLALSTSSRPTAEREKRADEIAGRAKILYPSAPPGGQLLWREASALLSLPRHLPKTGKEPRLKPFGRASTHREIWQGVRGVNRFHRGLFPGKEGENWQQDLARRLISTQRLDLESGGSFWQKKGKESALEETLFALLIFLEL